jgi:hypothetical protein
VTNGDVPDLDAIRRAREGTGLPSDPSQVPLAAALGQSFHPAKFGYVILQGRTAVGACVYLILETSVGRVAVAMDRNEAEGMAAQLVTQAEGLPVLPT